MNGAQIFLAALAAIFLVLFARNPRRPRQALSYGRFVLLAMASTAVLAPFLWIVIAAFKDKSVINQYMFLPPVDTWSKGSLNLDSFRELFSGKPSVSGTIY